MEACGEDNKESSEDFEGQLSIQDGKESLTDGDSLQYSVDDHSSDLSRSKGSTCAVDGASSFYPPVAAFHRLEALTTRDGVQRSRREISFNFADISHKAPSTTSHVDRLHSMSLKMPSRFAANTMGLKPAPPSSQVEGFSTFSHGRSPRALYPSTDAIFKAPSAFGKPYTESDSSFSRVTSDEHVGNPSLRRKTVAGASPFFKTVTIAQSRTKSPPSHKNTAIYGDAMLSKTGYASSQPGLERDSTEAVTKSPHKKLYPVFAEDVGDRKHSSSNWYRQRALQAETHTSMKVTRLRATSDESIDTASDIISEASPVAARFTVTRSEVASSYEPSSGQREKRQGITSHGRGHFACRTRFEPPSKSHSLDSCLPPAIPFRRSPGAQEPGLVGKGIHWQDYRSDGEESDQNKGTSSCCSVATIDSGIDLDEKTRNSIVASSTSMHISRRQRNLQFESTADDHTVATKSSGIDLDEKTRNTIISNSISMHVARRHTSSFVEVQDKNEEDEDEDDEKSVGSTTSGIELDDGIRRKIISRSTSMHMARRRSTMIEEDSKAPASTGKIRLGSETATASTPSDRNRKRSTPRVSTSSGSSSARSSFRKSSDKNSALRLSWRGVVSAGGTAAGPGGLSKLDPQAKANQNYNGLPFLPVMTSHLGVDAENPDAGGDVEAQAGVPVVLPGAFAVRPRSDDDLLEDSNSEYESDFEQNTIVTVDNPIRAEENPVGQSNISDQPPVLRPVVPGAPVQAELYEEVEVADAEVIDLTSSPTPKTSWKRVRCLRNFLLLLTCTIIGSVVLGVLVPKENDGSSCQENCTPKIKGWSQLGGALLGPLDNDNIQFGYKVAMSADGNRVAVGLPGLDAEDEAGYSSPFGGVLVMDYNGTNWNLVKELPGLETDGNAGTAVAISQDGTRVAFGAPGTSTGGYAAIYQESPQGVWSIVGDILREANVTGTTSFGSALALSATGDALAVGDIRASLGEELPEAGIVRVYLNEGSVWRQVGTDIAGTRAEELFGWSLDMSDDGRRVAASALGNEGGRGEVRMFDLQDGGWAQVGSTLVGETDGERFGFSISLGADGNVIAVGARGYSARKRDAGRVHVFEFDANDKDWTAVGRPIDGDGQSDQFGSAVALSTDGNTIAIGSPHSNTFGTGTGVVTIMTFDGTNWGQVGSVLGPEDGEGGLYGSSVDVSADGMRIVGGAPDFTYDGKLSQVGLAWAYQRDQI